MMQRKQCIIGLVSLGCIREGTLQCPSTAVAVMTLPQYLKMSLGKRIKDNFDGGKNGKGVKLSEEDWSMLEI
jgi:hypothetical protein